jgi:plasmid stability protein
MPTITLKNLPKPLHRELKARAIAHRRSLNSEVIATLEAATSPLNTPDVETMSRDARELRKSFKRMIRSSQISAWKNKGRP